MVRGKEKLLEGEFGAPKMDVCFVQEARHWYVFEQSG